MAYRETIEALTGGIPELANALDEKMKKTQLVKTLIRMRAKSGYSQAELAREMGCSQSRVSRIENSDDASLTIGDIEAYAKANGYWLELSVSNCGRNASGMIKYHIMQANALLEKIVKLAEDDKAILQGADDFSMEMLLNFCRFLDDATRKIPDSTFQKLLNSITAVPETAFELNCPEECLI